MTKWSASMVTERDGDERIAGALSAGIQILYGRLVGADPAYELVELRRWLAGAADQDRNGFGGAVDRERGAGYRGRTISQRIPGAFSSLASIVTSCAPRDSASATYAAS